MRHGFEPKGAVHADTSKYWKVDPRSSDLADRRRAANDEATEHDFVDLPGLHRSSQTGDLGSNGRIATFESFRADDLAAERLKAPLEAGAERFVVLDGIVEQDIGRLKFFVGPTELRVRGAFALSGNRGAEREGADTSTPILGSPAHNETEITPACCACSAAGAPKS